MSKNVVHLISVKKHLVIVPQSSDWQKRLIDSAGSLQMQGMPSVMQKRS